jgi:O-acetyl-ADP-ribose deacetylase (regulator of RNase III)
MNEVIQEMQLPGEIIMQIVGGDITSEQVDAIVNAANAQLNHGGGVAGAIKRRGGPKIQTESDDWVRKYGPITHDSPAYTTAGDLDCNYVIHSVGPIWGSGNEDEKLATTIENSLKLADKLEIQSISIPAISTGIFGFPKARAAGVILRAIKSYFTIHSETTIEKVRLTIIDQKTITEFINVLGQIDFEN